MKITIVIKNIEKQEMLRKNAKTQNVSRIKMYQKSTTKY